MFEKGVELSGIIPHARVCYRLTTSPFAPLAKRVLNGASMGRILQCRRIWEQ